MERIEYSTDIIHPTTPFEKLTTIGNKILLTCWQVAELKLLNTLIGVVHAEYGHPNFTKLDGYFEPGYIYGNVKIPKNSADPVLCPIISKVGIPTYQVS